MVTVNPIRSEADFDVAVARLGEIFFAEPGTPEGDEREVLSALVEAYDAEHYPIGPPSLAGALEFEMDQRELTHSDLVPILGSLENVYAALEGRRDLTMEMARALHKQFDIDAETLIQEPNAEADVARVAAD